MQIIDNWYENKKQTAKFLHLCFQFLVMGQRGVEIYKTKSYKSRNMYHMRSNDEEEPEKFQKSA